MTATVKIDRVDRPGWLVLDDGAVFPGRLVAAGEGPAWGEVVFNTALTGYQEIMTDPSYAGQLVVLTYPLIGNYGVDPAWAESLRPAARGVIVRQVEDPSPRSRPALAAYCRQYGLWLLDHVDTRALTRHLRDAGTRLGMVVDDPGAIGDVPRHLAGRSLHGIVDTVSTPAPFSVSGPGPAVTVIDYGVKQSILGNLSRRGARLTVLPSTATPDALAATRPAGVVLSNGPGDPADLTDRLDVVRYALEHYPTLGICLGHQLIGLAVGGRTFALKFGHHGANHPVQDRETGRVYITSQNHGYAVDPDSLPAGWRVRFVNLHDGTLEGLRHETRPVFTVQHHPEAGPGPHDAEAIFDEFLAAVGKERDNHAEAP
jgi:carbamoyl-phosphate synthase small subunit